MERLIFSISGYLTGFMLSTLFWGKTEGGVGLISNLRIPLGDKVLSLHHWMVFLLLLILLLIFRNSLSDKVFYFLMGIAMGGFHQGLTYNDWNLILK